jgi:hypothetical protein
MVALIGILISCSSISVNYDYDPGTDFSKYKTYRIYQKQIKGDALSRNQMVRKRVFISIEKVMGTKGYTKSESEEVDFVVVTHAGIKDRMQVTHWDGYGWYRPGWGTYGGYTDVSYYKEGNLVVNILDTEKKELAWRGVATGTISQPQQDADKQQKKLDDVLATVLKNFPPPKK